MDRVGCGGGGVRIRWRLQRRLWRRRCWVPAAEERGGAELFWVVVVVFCGVRRGAAVRGLGLDLNLALLLAAEMVM